MAWLTGKLTHHEHLEETPSEYIANARRFDLEPKEPTQVDPGVPE